MTKRLVTIQDLSCIGRCSLAVAMSLVPAMGVETAVLPTAILSTHTAFDSFTFLDFTPEAEARQGKGGGSALCCGWHDGCGLHADSGCVWLCAAV